MRSAFAPERLETLSLLTFSPPAPRWSLLGAAAFLVSLPVFVQAPLVRYAPWVGLVLTLFWLALSFHLMSLPKHRLWGNVLYGFTLTWLCGSLYWGWLRSEPLLHMPIETVALPVVIWGLCKGWAREGNYFFLGSLLGTAITDLYIHSVALLPHWRLVMQGQDPLNVMTDVLARMQTPWSLGCAAMLSLMLLVTGIAGWRWARWDSALWTFSGAVLSTLVVDGLFLLGVVSSV